MNVRSIAGPRPSGSPIPDEDWRTRAACVGADPRLFNERELPNTGRRPRRVPAEVYTVGRQYCGACPVREQCAAEADALDHDGVWGGVYRTSTNSRSKTEVRRYDLLASGVAAA